MTEAVRITRHAVTRYHERVCPGLERDTAAAQLEQLLAAAPLSESPPPWRPPAPNITLYAELADGICGLIGDLNGRRHLVTITVRGGQRPHEKARRRQRKARREELRRFRNELLGHRGQRIPEV